MKTPRTLVNLTGKPVFVLSGSALLALDEAPAPRPLEISSKAPSGEIAVHVRGKEVVLEEAELTSPVFTGPPVNKGVLWLVSSETLSQFPHRTDFVRPAWYQAVKLEELDTNLVSPQLLEREELVPGMVMVMIAVTRTPHVASEDAANLEDLEIIE